jgi:peptidoglycan/xylan/chitin deacetylase (PgdA/CDA1 family)
MKSGNFIISLDFELHWGVADLWSVKDRKEYFDTTRKSIPLVLEIFKKNKIHATWATVGFLFAKNKEQILEFYPRNIPSYQNEKLNYYNLIDNNEIGEDETNDPYHFAFSLINEIIKYPNQELATHTFSHYYCNENGQTVEQFDDDLKSAQAIAKSNFNIELKSLVFPRNQFNKEYVTIAKQNGIKVVRSNPNVWFWKNTSKYMALARAFDMLIPISRSLTFCKPITKEGVLELPASRFLRPYSPKESLIKNIKLNRIKSEMTYAAKNGKCYHLWWHPHNFGYSLNDNLIILENILDHFNYLKTKYNFQSKNMIEIFDDANQA